MDLEPFTVAERNPDGLLAGEIELTIVAGRIVYSCRPGR